VLSAEAHGVVVCGGNGQKKAEKPPSDIQSAGEKWDFSQEAIDTLTYTSRMTAKVDNTAIQAGLPTYHHAFLLTQDEKWAVNPAGPLRRRTQRTPLPLA
jgi:hypothetical protein